MTHSRSDTQWRRKSGSDTQDRPAVKPVLLVVDDDDGVCVSLRVVFGNDYEVVVAESSAAALETFRTGAVDVAIIDINMRDVTGIELLEELKQSDPLVEVIMLTGQGTLETSQQAIGLGAFAYLTKPFDLNEGRETVSRALARRRQMLAWRSLEQELHHRRLEQEVARVRCEIYSSVIHDLNSPLTATLGLLDLLRTEIDTARASGEPNLEELSRNATEARAQLDFCVSIIQRYFKDMRSQSEVEHASDVVEVLSDLEKMIRVHPSTRHNQCVIQIPEQQVFVKVNGLDLLHAMVNLVLNALQASENRTHVEVYCRHLPADQKLQEPSGTSDETFVFGDLPAEGVPIISITVQDDGPGIPPEQLRKVFDDYYTTKDGEGGAGLGLSVVKRVVKENHGALHLHSVPGEGTAFTLFFPAAGA